MDFKRFAGPLVDLAYPNLSKGAAVRQLFIDITSFDDGECNPLRDFEDSTCRGYLQEGRGISRIAGRALTKLDSDGFAEKIYGLPTDVIDMLIDEFGDELPELDSMNIGDCLAAEFVSIMKNAKRGSACPGESGRDGGTDSHSATEAELFLEASGKCPLCGAAICSNGSASRYKIVGITPPPAKKDYRKKREYEALVDEMPKLGSFEDKIALCLDCANRYESDPNPERFRALLSKKEDLRARSELTARIAGLDLDENLPVLLSRLGRLRDYDDLERLPMKALKVREKVDSSECLLIRKVEAIAAAYYNFIRTQVQILERQGDLDFTLLATQVRCCYLKLRNSGLSQELVFSRICEWMASRTGCESSLECEVLVAFFVQNCEVFDEIAK